MGDSGGKPMSTGRRRKTNFAMMCFISALLAIITISSGASASPEEPVNYEYSPKRQKYAIAPNALCYDSGFYDNYVKTDNAKYFNSITYFTNNQINYDTELFGYQAKFENSLYEKDRVLNSLVVKGDLLVNFRVCLANNGYYLRQYAGIQVCEYGTYESTSEFKVYGDKIYHKQYFSDLDIKYTTTYPGNQGSRMKNSSLLFADWFGPKTKEIYATSTIDGNRKYKFNQNDEEVFIHVKFDEYIRLSDNNRYNSSSRTYNPHYKIRLKLAIGDIGGNPINDAEQYAELVRIKDDTLTFRYEIPDTIKGSVTNHCITGISGIVDFDDDRVNTVNGRKVPGDALNAPAGKEYELRLLTYTGELRGHWEGGVLKLYKSNSLITDLAGNPAQIEASKPVKNIYIDRVSPHVTAVSITTGNNSVYVGPGSTITPSVTFNEAICKYYAYMDDYLTLNVPEKFIATLNIKDSSGNYLTVRGSLQSKNTVSFKPLRLPGVFTVDTVGGDEPNRVRVTSVSISEGDYEDLNPTDERGNRLERVHDLTGVNMETQIIADSTAPVIETDLQEQSGRYKPVIPSEDSFWFSFRLDDAGGSGVVPRGDTSVKGSFKWELDDDINLPAGTMFRYIFKSSAECPGDDDTGWKDGLFGGVYEYTQFDSAGEYDNIFIHVRAVGLDGVDLDDSKLTLTAFDRVGNKSERTFVLDGGEVNSILDKTAPVITLNRKYTYKDDGGTWRFAADFTVTDNSLVDINKIYSQWTESDAGPDEDNWEKVTVPGSNDKTVSGTAEYELPAGQSCTRYLYLKAFDCSDKENNGWDSPYIFVINLAKPVFEASYSVEKTTMAALVIEAEAQSATVIGEEGDPQIPAAILVTVGNSYKSLELSSDIDTDVFAGGGGWYYVSDGAHSDDSTLANILDGTYYGEFDVKVDIGYGISYSGGVLQAEDYSLLETYTYRLYTAPSSVPPPDCPIHGITITSNLPDPETWSSPDDGPKYRTDLTGVSFTITVNNARVPGWGVEDVDFNNCYFAIYRAEDNSEVFREYFKSNTVTISIPAERDFPEGEYYAKAVVTAKTSGRVDESEGINIRIDRTEPGEFGLSAVETTWRIKEDPADPAVEALFEKIGAKIDRRGYDSIYNLDAEGYESIPTVLVGSGDNGYADPVRKLYFTTKSANPDFYIKIWNATEGIDDEQSRASAHWQRIGTMADEMAGAAFTVRVVGNADEVIGNYSPGVIPVIDNTDNIILFQLCHANGIKSDERTLLAKVSDKAPVLEYALTPEIPSRQVDARVTRLHSESGDVIDAFFWEAGIMGDPEDVVADAEGNISLQQVENNWLYASNDYGNYAIVEIHAPNLDLVPPEAASGGFVQDGDMYRFSVTVRDKYFSELLMKFDDTYMERLKLSGYFRLEVPGPAEAGTEETWTADSPRSDGIYKIVRTDSHDGTINLDITGVYLYDDGGGIPPETVNVGYSLLARDEAGNETELAAPASPVRNAQVRLSLEETVVEENVSYNSIAGLSSQVMDLYSMRASFNLPVRNVTPLQHHGRENSYSLTKDFVSIFRDGTYTVTYVDIFGKKYNEEKTVSVSNDMNISMTGLNEEGKFTLWAEPAENEGRIHIPANEGKQFTMFADVYDATLFGGWTRVLSARRAGAEFEADETAIIAMMRYEDRPGSEFDGWYLDNSVPIIMVDGSTRREPTVVIRWYYHEFDSDTPPPGETETDGEVEVSITSDTPITGINGKLLTHTFRYGEPESYTFEYANSEGVTGRTTVTLPIPIVPEKEDHGDGHYYPDDRLGIDEGDLYQKPPDTKPPAVIFSVFGRVGTANGQNIMENKGEWCIGLPAGNELENLFTWSSAFAVRMFISDASDTRAILLRGIDPDISGITFENVAGENVQGAVLDGDRILITAEVTANDVNYPEDFTLLVIDEAGYYTAISFPESWWSQLDVIAPQICDLSYRKTGFTKVEASFSLWDDKAAAGQVKLLSPAGLAYDPATGIYAMEFTENRGVQAVLTDLAGNLGTGMISVDFLDDQPPSVVSVWYSKGGVNDEGEYDPGILTTEKTNHTIAVRMTFDKQVTKVELADVKGNNYEYSPPSEDWPDHVTLSWDPDGAVLEFLQNAYARLSFTAFNGKSNTYDIAVFDVIDKSVPVITVDKQDNVTDTYAVVTFTNPADTGEPVRVYGPGETGSRLFGPGDVITKTFTQRGTYIYRFTDAAGNTRTEKVVIENIDEIPPGILLAELPPEDVYYTGPVIFKATMSEAGTLTFNGVTATVEAPVDTDGDGEIDTGIEDNECDWHTFTVTQNGNFPITAVDIAGRKTVAYLGFNCFDREGPSIYFDPIVITVMSGTDPDNLLELLERGVTVRDNSTAAADIILTHDDVNNVDLSLPGQYQVAFAATDKAGNTTTARRYVKVFDANAVKVMVNGTLTEPGAVTALDDLQVTLEISKMPMGDNEPYKVYLRKGKWTAGQMKGLKPLDRTDGFTLPARDSFYTLFIVTQNRGTYLTYLYTEE